MNYLKCPNCKLTNPLEKTKCDCGYNFEINNSDEKESEEDKKYYNDAKVWNPNSLKYVTIFLSGITGIILYVMNYYKLDHPKKKQKLLLGILFLVILTGVILIIPDYKELKYVFFGINFSLGVYYSSEQKGDYLKHLENGGRKASVWSAIGLSILFLLAYFSIIAIVVFMSIIILG